MQLNKLTKSIILSTSLLSIFSVASAEEIRVAIGTQDTTINCATGGLLIRELNLLPNTYQKRVNTKMPNMTSCGKTLLLAHH